LKGDGMQDKIMMFAVGIVAGIILSTGTFFIFEITRNSINNHLESDRHIEFHNNSKPEIPNSKFEDNSNEQFKNGNRKLKNKTKKDNTNEIQESDKNNENV
jgi:hypothetical protein